MMEEDFYATVKLKTGEEIFARVTPSEENDKTILLIVNPIIVSEFSNRSGTGYKIEPWLKTTTEDMFIINMSDVITISESKDGEIISLYQSYLNRTKSVRQSSRYPISRKMGYLSNVNDAKKLLEKLYNNS